MFGRGKLQVNAHPEPPKLEHIHEDINKADEDDVVFMSNNTPGLHLISYINSEIIK